MYGSIAKDRNSIWCITGYGVWKGSKYAYNTNINVIAKTMEEAMLIVKTNNPEVKFVSINHKGIVYESN